MLTISVGRGRRNPAGERVTVEDLAEGLEALEPGLEAWWSPHLWTGDQRSIDRWEGAHAIAVDVDHGDGSSHTEAPESSRQAVLHAWESGALPGSVFHLTPRGFRVVFVLEQPAGIPQFAAYSSAVAGAACQVAAAIVTTGLAGLGYAVDHQATDLARFLYTPRALVNGVQRQDRVLSSGHVYTLSDFDPPPPPSMPPPGVGGQVIVSGKRKPSPALEQAVAAWNAAHPRAFPKNGGACPACGNPSSFGQMPSNPLRWYCFAAGHGERAGGCGLKGRQGFHGDALDLDAFQAGKGRVEFLLEQGVLSHQDLAPLRDKPTALVPGTHVLPDDVMEGGVLDMGTHAFTQAVLDVLPDGLLYRRGRVVGALEGERGARKFVPLSVTAMRMVVDAHLCLVHWVMEGKGDAAHPVAKFRPCTADLALLVVEAAATSPKVRDVRLLVQYPVFAGEDMALSAPGWNPTTGVFYDEPEELVGLVPSPGDPRDAWAPLHDLLVDFPFANAADVDNAVGLCITLLTRPAIEGNVPMHLLLASVERTGKTLLVNTLARLVTGRDAPTLQMGTDEAEREKRITSLILEGSTLVHLDNLATSDDVDSASLASLLTSRTWKGRILGRSELPELVNGLTIVGSGNNVRMSPEMSKRVVPVNLRPLTPHPERRTEFRHPDLDSGKPVRERRRGILAGLLGMVVSWRDAGRQRPAVRLGGFESWVHVVGGVCMHAGATEWCGNLDTWTRSADEWGSDLEVLAGAWWRRFSNADVTAQQALVVVKELGLYPRVTARPDGAAQVVALSRFVLRAAVDRPVGSWVFRAKPYGSATRYSLEVNPHATQAPPPPPPATGSATPAVRRLPVQGEFMHHPEES